MAERASKGALRLRKQQTKMLGEDGRETHL